MTAFVDQLRAIAGAERVSLGVQLAPFTTFRVGGPADMLFEPRRAEEIVEALHLAAAAGVPVTMLGGGSNALVSDAGVRGLVIRPAGGTAILLPDTTRVRADAAMNMTGLVRWTIRRALAGLAAWAGTPGTVGGAIFGNAHFDGQLIGTLVTSVQVANRRGETTTLAAGDMEFGYDRSRLQTSGEVLLTADFHVTPGDKAELQATAAASLDHRKRTQPLKSLNAGCVFQNPQPGLDQVPDGIPWSAGALVDRARLKGSSIGGATVSLVHGNFIINTGAASARDIRRLIVQCREAVREQFGVTLREEIVYLGDFDVDTAN